MDEKELSYEYYNWMCQLVSHDENAKGLTFHKLLTHLNSVDYYYILPMDSNRAYDGINLRYRFGYEKKYEDYVIANMLDIRPCSVLEMMVALAFRCEESIMHDVTIGDRTWLWFWTMISNLCLSEMDDDNYNREYVDDALSMFLNREHSPYGGGSLFVIMDTPKDLRDVDIWCQLNWFLNRLTNREMEEMKKWRK